MNRCVERMHRYVEMSLNSHLLFDYLQTNSVFLTNAHLITRKLRYLRNSRVQFCHRNVWDSSEQILWPDYLFHGFSNFTPLVLLQFLIEILGSHFVIDSELLRVAFLHVSPENPLYTVFVLKKCYLVAKLVVFSCSKVILFSVPLPWPLQRSIAVHGAHTPSSIHSQQFLFLLFLFFIL